MNDVDPRQLGFSSRDFKTLRKSTLVDPNWELTPFQVTREKMLQEQMEIQESKNRQRLALIQQKKLEIES